MIFIITRITEITHLDRVKIPVFSSIRPTAQSGGVSVYAGKGATVEQAVVKGFPDRKGNPDVTLFDASTQSLNFTFSAKETNISTQDLYFNVSEVTDTTAVFTAEAGNGKEIIINYLLGKDYMLHMKMQVNGMAGLSPTKRRTALPTT